MMPTKIILISVMLIILASLMSSLIFLIRDKGERTRSVKTLTLRIGLSIALIIFLCLAFHFHWIAPHDLQQ